MEYNSSSFNESAYFWPSNLVDIQQDTTFRPTAIDSAEAKVFGVDPIFIMNERRTKEIEEYKINQKRIAAWRAKQALKAKIDTTCYICPTGDNIELHNLVQSPIEEINSFNLLQGPLYDKSHFEATKPRSFGTVYIEEKPIRTTKISSLKEEVRPQQSNPQSNWIYFPLFGLFIMLAILKVFYQKFINYFIQSSIYTFVASKLHRENSLLGQRIILILDMVYFFSTTIFIVLALDNVINFQNFDLKPEVLSIVVFSILIAFRLIRYMLVIVSGYLSRTLPDLKELYFHQLIYSRIFGIFLVPLLLIFAYSKDYFASTFLYLIIFLAVILLIIRTIRSFRVFINKGFSIFYFLLYLCALEIAPLLIFLKEVFGE